MADTFVVNPALAGTSALGAGGSTINFVASAAEIPADASNLSAGANIASTPTSGMPDPNNVPAGFSLGLGAGGTQILIPNPGSAGVSTSTNTSGQSVTTGQAAANVLTGLFTTAENVVQGGGIGAAILIGLLVWAITKVL